MTATASSQLVEYLTDALAPLGPVHARRFFGGTALTLDGVQFAFVMRGHLYLRVDAESRGTFEARGSAPFSYETKARRMEVASYYAAPPEILDDPDALHLWAARAHKAALAAQRPGPRRGRRTSRHAGDQA